MTDNIEFVRQFNGAAQLPFQPIIKSIKEVNYCLSPLRCKTLDYSHLFSTKYLHAHPRIEDTHTNPASAVPSITKNALTTVAVENAKTAIRIHRQEPLPAGRNGVVSVGLIESSQRPKSLQGRKSVSGNRTAGARRLKHVNPNSCISSIAVDQKGDEKLMRRNFRAMEKSFKVKAKNMSFIRRHSKNEDRMAQLTIDNFNLLSECSRPETLKKTRK